MRFHQSASFAGAFVQKVILTAEKQPVDRLSGYWVGKIMRRSRKGGDEGNWKGQKGRRDRQQVEIEEARGRERNGGHGPNQELEKLGEVDNRTFPNKLLPIFDMASE
jgi:hypothetical protein